MEILRCRLSQFGSNDSNTCFHEMAKPCRAKRQLFVDCRQSENMPSFNGNDICTRSKDSTAVKMSFETLQRRYTDFEIMSDPPHPYRTVTKSAKARTVVVTDRTDPEEARVAEITRPTTRPTTQTVITDHYKLRKRSLTERKLPVETTSKRHKNLKKSPSS